MSYIDGFVAAVPAGNREAYRRHAEEAAPLFREFGATRLVETWGDDVPDGKVTDFKGSVLAEEGEVVVFSWMEYPDRETRDAAGERMMSDPRMEQMGASMPFDGKRMIFGGFEPLVDESKSGTGGDAKGDYADGYLVAVPKANRDAYRALAQKAAPIFLEHGAVRVVEAWESDVPAGKITDFRRAVKAQDEEAVVFSFVEWPSRETRQEGWKKIMEDERMQPGKEPMPFDGKRMIYGGFEMLLDTSRS